MRSSLGILLLALTGLLVYKLDQPMGSLPALGRLVDPINGCWTSAEDADKNFTETISIPSLSHNAQVWFDARMVPHIHAASDHDIYYLEGYIHAYFRLWQMDMETRAAAGKVSEVIGIKGFEFDRKQRRKGMIYAAEQSLKAMEADPRTKVMMDAYTEGINAYISQLKFRDFPLEYKLMGFKPEPWTNIKSALLLKYMADDLTGATDDIPLSYLREVLSPEIFQLLYPESITGSKTIIPHGTIFEKPSLGKPTAPANTIFPHFTKKDFKETREDGIGSNNWAISGSRTKSGATILCDDPHLGLNLPSLWYEIQMQSPGMNVYGVSLPGAPGVIIGFNDSLAWGFTNNYRDVKDFYLVKKVEGNNKKYWFDGQQRDFTQRLEHIIIKGEKEFVDTVNYSLHGPVMYDERYAAEGGLGKPLAMCWMAHRSTNELLAVYQMNRAKDYNSFVDGILNFQCPAQNMIYADKAGNIAAWGQGQFVNKWKDQGKYIMDGSDKAALWGHLIPMRENPHVLNPPRGYVFSANECITDSTYPYWYNQSFVEFRAWRIDQVLDTLPKATIQDMFALQNDNYSVLAANMLPLMLRLLPDSLGDREKVYANQLRNWNYRLSAGKTEGSIFQVWWFYLYNKTWSDLSSVPSLLYPTPERTMQLLQLADSGKVKLKELENLPQLMSVSLRQAADSLEKARKKGLEWYKVKNTTVSHLSRLPAFGFSDLKIGGWGNTVNAAKGNHGPSWRMVVQLGKEIEAYGVYPGGQSGNPGSKYYANFLNQWVAGRYNKLLFLPFSDKQNTTEIKYTWTINK